MSSEIWRQRIQKELMKDLREFAKADRRSISDYITILLEDYVAAVKSGKGIMVVPKTVGRNPQQTPSPPAQPSPAASPIHRIPAPNAQKMAEIAMSDGPGWEGGKE